MNIRVFPSEQDDIVNSLNYEGIAVIELVKSLHFPDSDRLRVGSVTDQAEWISSYGDQSTTRE